MPAAVAWWMRARSCRRIGTDGCMFVRKVNGRKPCVRRFYRLLWVHMYAKKEHKAPAAPATLSLRTYVVRQDARSVYVER